MFNLFKRQKNTPPVKHKKQSANRSFVGAKNTGMNRFNVTYAKINEQLRQDYIGLVLRARSLYKNNDTVASFVNLMLRNILGNQGFILNVTAYNQDGTSDLIANKQIEDNWYNYTRNTKKYVSADEQLNGLDFDRQLIFNYLIDGQVFVRRYKDKKSPYTIRYSIVDSLQVDTMYNVEYQQDNTKIVMGIKVDADTLKPLSYFIRKNKSSNYYLTGQRIEVPADQIIHIYKPLYAGQVRGFTPLAPVLLSLNSLDEYKRAQISASLLNAAFMGIWQRQSADANSYDEYDEEQVDNQGNVAIELESNVFRYAPDGFKLNQIASNHPNNSVKDFCKVILKGICSCLGLNYNNVTSDYSETSYSSQRAANIQDELTVKELGQFIIDNWKDRQYEDFLKYLLLSDLTSLPYSKIDKFLSHDFQVRNMTYIDPQKEMAAIQLRLALGLSSPIEQIHNSGRDPIDVLNSIQKWNQMLKDRGLKFDSNASMITAITANLEEEKLQDEV